MNLITMVDCMKPIGGYFGWEFPLQQKPIPHERGVFVNSGHHALALLLKCLKPVRKVYVPVFTCGIVHSTIAGCIIGKTKGALFAKRKVHKKINYIATEADIKSVSASVTYTCLLSMFFRVQTLFKHSLNNLYTLYTLSINLTSFSPCKRRNVLRRLLS